MVFWNWTEAVAVGVTAALDFDEYVLPLHRNLGVFTTRMFHLSVYFHNFKVKNWDLLREEIGHFILVLKKIILLE